MNWMNLNFGKCKIFNTKFVVSISSKKCVNRPKQLNARTVSAALYCPPYCPLLLSKGFLSIYQFTKCQHINCKHQYTKLKTHTCHTLLPSPPPQPVHLALAPIIVPSLLALILALLVCLTIFLATR